MKDFELMTENKIKEFVRKAGSEQKAIEKLMHICLPDTISHNDYEKMIWYRDIYTTLHTEGYYASRKIQAYFWIQRIYHADYSINGKKNRYFIFIRTGNVIFDYQDLDIDKKYHFLTQEFHSKSSRDSYAKNLGVGYVKTNSDSYKKLEDAFNVWYLEMKEKGLQYMRENGITPPTGGRLYHIVPIKMPVRGRSWKRNISR
jgi:hypothetical protein